MRLELPPQAARREKGVWRHDQTPTVIVEAA